MYVLTGTNLLSIGRTLMQVASIGLNLGVGVTLGLLAKTSIKTWCVALGATHAEHVTCQAESTLPLLTIALQIQAAVIQVHKTEKAIMESSERRVWASVDRPVHRHGCCLMAGVQAGRLLGTGVMLRQ